MKKETAKPNPRNSEPAHDLDTVIDAVRGEGAFAPPKDSKQEPSSFGNTAIIAQRLGVARRTVYNYVKRWKGVADAIDDEKEKRKDFVEDRMLKRIMEGSDTMIIWFSKTQMKDRGFVERQELTGPEGGVIPIAIVQQSVWEKVNGASGGNS